ncbi:MAG: hypothetical protein V3T05_00730 [Myxococcota bacterium]
MGESDDRRVEPRTSLVGRGIGTTPERIHEIQRRALEIEKLDRAKPTREFSAVMADVAAGMPDEDELTEKEKKQRALPKKGPRPGLVHPSQRDVYGREDGEEDPVVLKG